MDNKTRKKQLIRNVWLVSIFNFFQGAMFFIPILAIYIKSNLFTVFNVGLVLGVQSLSTILFEVPSGAFTDIFGRKKTMLLSIILAAIGLIFLFIGSTLPIFLIFAILWGISTSLKSGTLASMIYDSLAEVNQTSTFKKLVGINHAMWPLGASIGSAIGGFLAKQSLSLPIIMTFVPLGASLIAIFMMREPKYHKDTDNNILKQIRRSIKAVKENKQLILLLLAGFVVYFSGEVAHNFKPIFFEYKLIPIEYFGIFFAVTFILSSLGAILSHYVSDVIGNKNTILLNAFLTPILIFTSTFQEGFIAGAIIISGSIFWGFSFPVNSYLINLESKAKQRTTIISISNLANQLGLFIALPLFGYFGDLYNINVTFKLTALVAILAFVIYLFIEDKIE